MKSLSEDVRSLAVEMRRVGERMEADGRRKNKQHLIDHAAELQNAAHTARVWVLEIEPEEKQ